MATRVVNRGNLMVQGSRFRVQGSGFRVRRSSRRSVSVARRSSSTPCSPRSAGEPSRTASHTLSHAELGSKLLHIVARGKHQVELQALGKRGASGVALSQRRKVVRHVQVNLRVTGRSGRAFGEKLFGLLVVAQQVIESSQACRRSMRCRRRPRRPAGQSAAPPPGRSCELRGHRQGC